MPDPYLSEIKYRGGANLDFVEVAVDQGTDVSNIQVIIYNPNGTVRSTNALGAIDGTIAGRDVYTLDDASSATFNGVHQNGAVALVVNGTVTQFLSFNRVVTASQGPASGMTATQLGQTSNGASWETSDNGATYDNQTNPTPNTVPCFLSGTHIAVPGGTSAVEDLRVGDPVWTEDAGHQPILWTGARSLSVAECVDKAAAPVRIPAGAFGPGAPQRDVMVSPNHRLALSHPLCALYFQSDTVLVSAKALTGYRGIGPCPVRVPVRYHHLLLPRHHILRANGLASESFLPEPMGLAALRPAARCALLAALDTGGDSDRRAARVILRPSEAMMLMQGAAGDTLDMLAGLLDAIAA